MVFSPRNIVLTVKRSLSANRGAAHARLGIARSGQQRCVPNSAVRGETEAERDAAPVSSGSPGGKPVSHVQNQLGRHPGTLGRNVGFADGYAVFPGSNSSRGDLGRDFPAFALQG